jgi:hypothetical protein
MRNGLRRIEKKQELKTEQLHLCYEAGPTGFGLARHLIGPGYNCIADQMNLPPECAGHYRMLSNISVA